MTAEARDDSPIPSFSEVDAAYGEVVAHNTRYTGPQAAQRANLEIHMDNLGLTPGMDLDEVPIELQEVAKTIFQEYDNAADVTEGDMRGELQEVLHSETFLRAGITLGPFDSYMVDEAGERITSTALVPFITNTALFAEFLATVTPEEMRLDNSQPLLPAVLANLHKVVSRCYDPDVLEASSADERQVIAQVGEDSLRTFVAIDPELQRLGFDAKTLRAEFPGPPQGTPGVHVLVKPGDEGLRDSQGPHDLARDTAHTYEMMETYIEYWGRDVLPEFMMANKYGFLREPSKGAYALGPGHGYLVDNTQYYWGRGMELINRLSHEDCTEPQKAFGEEVRLALVKSTQAALDDIRTLNGGYYAGQSDELENVIKALKREPYDAGRFEDYTRDPAR